MFPFVKALFGIAVNGGAHAVERFQAHLFPFVGGAVGDGGRPGGKDGDALMRDFFADVGEPVDGGELAQGDGGGGLHDRKFYVVAGLG